VTIIVLSISSTCHSQRLTFSSLASVAIFGSD
jgi:hypothetical protein